MDRIQLPQTLGMKKPLFSNLPINHREKQNWLIHILFLRQEYDQCLKIIEEMLSESQGKSEYALYVKALVLRIKGNIHESLELFKKCHLLNPQNIDYLKQFGRSLYLLGRHKAAIEVFDECLNIDKNEWEVYYYKGLSYKYLRIYDEAIACFQQANVIHKHDQTFIELGKVYTAQQDYKSAIEVYLEGLEFSPENPDILTTIGLLYIRLGENFQAFQFLGNSLTHDPKNPKTILATGSIIQDKSDHDAALLKYRIAAVYNPDSAELWNNIGMCFFGKQKYVAAVACLKRALYLDPFQWIAAFNLGLVHLNTGQYASSFHYFSAAINLKPDFSNSYMYLAITLNKLGDFDSACAAFQKALEIESNDCTIFLNFAITLYNNGQSQRAKEMFQQSEKIFLTLDDEDKEPEIIVFPAPTCSYSTETLFKDLIYIPKYDGLGYQTESIPCLYLPYEHETKILFFFHGNAEDLGIAYDILKEIRNSLKVSIFAMEYPGYGLYVGETGSDKVLNDALFVFDHLVNKLGVSSSDIVVFGRSIGCCPASYLAKNRNPAALILMSPFKSIRDVAKDLVGRMLAYAIADRFRNIDTIRDIRCPVFIVHGQKDKLIPYQHAQDLHDACINSTYCKLLLPPKMDHNDFEFYDDFIEPFQEFMKQTNLRLDEVESGSKFLSFSDEYYFPPQFIINYEKKLIKNSIIWDIIEERNKQQQRKELQQQKDMIQKTDKVEMLNFANLRRDSFIQQESTKEDLAGGVSSSDQLSFPHTPQNMVKLQDQLSKQLEDYDKLEKQKRQKMIQNLINDGYEWTSDKQMGVRNTTDKISIKF